MLPDVCGALDSRNTGHRGTHLAPPRCPPLPSHDPPLPRPWPAPGLSSPQDPYLSSGPPLWQTATYAQPGATSYGEYDYTRSGNPSRTMLEEAMAALEGADRAFAFTR